MQFPPVRAPRATAVAAAVLVSLTEIADINLSISSVMENEIIEFTKASFNRHII